MRKPPSPCRNAPTYVAMALLFLVLGCDPSIANDPNAAIDAGRQGGADHNATLDVQLQARLVELSHGEGLQFFMLPSSHHLQGIPQDPKNPLTMAKVKLGQRLYHETALGVNNVRPEGRETYSCASCHFAQGGFMANRAQGIAEGGSGFGSDGEARTLLPQYDFDPWMPDVQPIRTPTVLNGAFQELMLWNGQFGAVGDNLGTEDRWTSGTPVESNHLGLHGLEIQAHAGLAVHRMRDVELSRVASIPAYRGAFSAAFPGEDQPIDRYHAALAIAAFERTVLANRAPWQRWLRGHSSAMTVQEKRGAMLFFGEANCVACHTGPALNSMSFYALGMNDLDGAYASDEVDLRHTGGTVPEGTRLGRGGFTGVDEDNWKFKTPQLYNLADSPFYGHGASFATVAEVVEYKNAAVPENELVPASVISERFTPLGLSASEVDDLVAFLEGALYDPNLMRYVPRQLPSGNCTPVNDPLAQEHLGCRARKAPSDVGGAK